MQSPYAKRMSRNWNRTLELILGTFKNFLSGKRVNTRGIEKSNKHSSMSSVLVYGSRMLQPQKTNEV